MTSVACPANCRYRRETAILPPQLLLWIVIDRAPAPRLTVMTSYIA